MIARSTALFALVAGVAHPGVSSPPARGDQPTPPIAEAFRKATPEIPYGLATGIELEPAAVELAKTYRTGAARFLKEKLAKGTRQEKELAVITLAKLADDADVAAHLLSKVKELADHPPFELVPYFPPKARDAALGKLLAGEPDGRTLALAAAAGGAEHLKRVEEIVATFPAASHAAAWARIARDRIKARLARPTATERAGWAAAELGLWKVQVARGPDVRNNDDQERWRAHRLSRAGVTVPAAFLKENLSGSGYDTELIVWIAGVQRESALVDDLLRIAKGSERLALSAQWALAMIGTDGALRGIEAMLVPLEKRERIHDNIARALIGHGDAKSLAVLARVRDDTNFVPADLITFDDAHRRLKSRLEDEAKRAKR